MHITGWKRPFLDTFQWEYTFANRSRVAERGESPVGNKRAYAQYPYWSVDHLHNTQSISVERIGGLTMLVLAHQLAVGDTFVKHPLHVPEGYGWIPFELLKAADELKK